MVTNIYGAYEQLIEHLWSDDGHTHTQSHPPIPLIDSSESSINNMALILLIAVQQLVWFGKILHCKARRGWVTFGEVAWIFACQGHINQVSRRRLTQWQDKAMTGLGSDKNLTSSVSACANQMVTRWGRRAPSAGFSVSRSPFPSLSTTSTSSTKRSAL